MDNTERPIPTTEDIEFAYIDREGFVAQVMHLEENAQEAIHRFYAWYQQDRAELVRRVARRALDEQVGIPFDNDYDVATVAAWIDEVADEVAEGNL